MSTHKQSIPHAPSEARASSNQKVTTAVAGVAFTSFTAFLTALYMPRGPVTAVQLWLVLFSSLAIGLIGGLALRTRWAYLLLPLIYIVVVELTRLNIAGPTVDALRLDNPFGILALLVGRGFHGLTAFLPMWLGVGIGLAWAQGQSVWRPSAAAARPAADWPGHPQRHPRPYPPVVDENGSPIPGSLAELTTVRLGGQEQAIMLHGRSADLPVLLYLSGGPGQSDLAYSRVLLADLAQDFIVVGWDQRGTGKSYAALDPTSDLTLDQAVADTIELTHYLRERFDEKKST
jgi:proline iminopeptidase